MANPFDLDKKLLTKMIINRGATDMILTSLLDGYTEYGEEGCASINEGKIKQANEGHYLEYSNACKKFYDNRIEVHKRLNVLDDLYMLARVPVLKKVYSEEEIMKILDKEKKIIGSLISATHEKKINKIMKLDSEELIKLSIEGKFAIGVDEFYALLEEMEEEFEILSKQKISDELSLQYINFKLCE